MIDAVFSEIKNIGSTYKIVELTRSEYLCSSEESHRPELSHYILP